MFGIRFLHIAGYSSILLLLVGFCLFRRNACKRGGLFSAKTRVEPYTSLGQRDDGWDNWEDVEPQIESGMFAAYR